MKKNVKVAIGITITILTLGAIGYIWYKNTRGGGGLFSEIKGGDVKKNRRIKIKSNR